MVGIRPCPYNTRRIGRCQESTPAPRRAFGEAGPTGLFFRFCGYHCDHRLFRRAATFTKLLISGILKAQLGFAAGDQPAVAAAGARSLSGDAPFPLCIGKNTLLLRSLKRFFLESRLLATFRVKLLLESQRWAQSQEYPYCTFSPSFLDRIAQIAHQSRNNRANRAGQVMRVATGNGSPVLFLQGSGCLSTLNREVHPSPSDLKPWSGPHIHGW